MEAQERRHDAVLFDFFGTLVNFQPDRTRLSYPDTHRLLQRWGYERDHDVFVEQWDAGSGALEAGSAITYEEFTMVDAAMAFARTAGLELSQDQAHELAATFSAEWQRSVHPIEGVTELIVRLSSSYLLGVVSNTHEPGMVPSMLRAMGVVDCFELIVLSVDHGYRKPHPSIYERALEIVGSRPENVAFVGDSYEADYLGQPEQASMPT